MCIGHGRLCVCVSVCTFRRIPTLLHGPGCKLGNGKGCPVVVHYWADLQSVHGFRCYDNVHAYKFIALYTANTHSAKREMSASACTRSMPDLLIVWESFCNDYLFEINDQKRHLVIFGTVVEW